MEPEDVHELHHLRLEVGEAHLLVASAKSTLEAGGIKKPGHKEAVKHPLSGHGKRAYVVQCSTVRNTIRLLHSWAYNRPKTVEYVRISYRTWLLGLLRGHFLIGIIFRIPLGFL